jgi:hypothetical protein
LIDTGAPVTVFDRATADALCIRIGNAGAETRLTGLMGRTLTLQFETVELSLLHDPSRAWEARVGFITDPAFQMPFQGLLGTEGFLDRWAVVFNRYYSYFQILSPDEVDD